MIAHSNYGAPDGISLASILLKATVPAKVVSERLGHSSPAFATTVYQHVLPGTQATQLPPSARH